jgi:hypothetical protein
VRFPERYLTFKVESGAATERDKWVQALAALLPSARRGMAVSAGGGADGEETSSWEVSSRGVDGDKNNSSREVSGRGAASLGAGLGERGCAVAIEGCAYAPAAAAAAAGTKPRTSPAYLEKLQKVRSRLGSCHTASKPVMRCSG